MSGILTPTMAEGDMPAGPSDPIFNRLLKDRIIWMGEEVKDDMANRICAQMLMLAAEDPKSDIWLYINSPGGSITAGMAIYDTMQLIEPDVATVGIGIALGAGRYFVGCAVTGLIVLIQVVLHHRTPLVRPQKVGTVVLRLTNPQLEAAVCTRLAGMAERIESIHFRRLDGDMVEITCDVIFATDYNAEHLVRALQDIPELYSVEMRWP